MLVGENGCGFCGLVESDGDVVKVDVSGVCRLHRLTIRDANNVAVCGCLYVITGCIWT